MTCLANNRTGTAAVRGAAVPTGRLAFRLYAALLSAALAAATAQAAFGEFGLLRY
ncbi:MAG TPA: hypothetical protein VMB18_09965 [Terriglobales bacterium]|nr:hypothetical protein [Terriglobales bacterium]